MALIQEKYLFVIGCFELMFICDHFFTISILPSLSVYGLSNII